MRTCISSSLGYSFLVTLMVSETPGQETLLIIDPKPVIPHLILKELNGKLLWQEANPGHKDFSQKKQASLVSDELTITALKVHKVDGTKVYHAK